jgi:hypothetical protein
MSTLRKTPSLHSLEFFQRALMGVVLAAKKDLSISQTHSEKGTFCRQHN